MQRHRREDNARSQETAKRKKFTVILDQEQLERFERYCRERGFKKSTLTARLIREYLDREGFGQPTKIKPDHR